MAIIYRYVVGKDKRTWSLRLSSETVSVIETIMLDIKMDMIKKQRGRWSVPEDEVFRAVLKEHLECIEKKDKERYQQLVKQIEETGGSGFFKE